MTTTADVFVPELLADAVYTGFGAGVNLLLNSGAVVINPTLPTKARGGSTVTVPYFNTIGEWEDLAEGVALTPASVTSDEETATVQRTGKAFEITDWVSYAAAYVDAYGHMASQVIEGAQIRFDRALISKAFAADAPMTNDISAVAGAGSNITYGAMLDTQSKWGDDFENIALITMHSQVFYYLNKQLDTTGRPLAVETFRDDGTAVRRYLGKPVLVSDRSPVAAGVYTTGIIKKNALALWYNKTPDVETDRDVLKKATVVACDAWYTAHKYKKLPGSTLPGVAMLKHKINQA